MNIDRFHDSRPCRVLIFTSPKAGSGASRQQLPRLVELLAGCGIASEMIHSADQLRDRAGVLSPRESLVVVAAGGDGTLSLAACLVSPEVPIVPMPLGTENLLARQFGHRALAESVLQTIRHGSTRRIDAGMAGGKPFLIMATCGFDAEVVRGMHLTRRGHIRRISYLAPIMRAVRMYAFPRIEVQVDGGQPIECAWAMIFNLPCYAAGLAIEPQAIGDDGQLDVIAFRGGTLADGLKYLAGIKTGWHVSFPDVLRQRGSTIDIRSVGRVPYQLDGDYVGRVPLRIETMPQRVCLVLPPSPVPAPTLWSLVR